MPHQCVFVKNRGGTPFAQRRASLVLPNEDTVCDLYEQACEELEAAGFQQYEISNLPGTGFESRHNLKYWNAEEYLTGQAALRLWDSATCGKAPGWSNMA